MCLHPECQLVEPPLGERGPACCFTARWRQARLRHEEELVPLLDAVVEAMAGAGYTARDCRDMRLALEEAVVNGLKHGNGNDPTKWVCVRYCVTADTTVTDVEDQGPGFDPTSVPDPTAPENLERPSGRGLLLMRHFTTWVRFHDRGNRVTLCKCRAAGAA